MRLLFKILFHLIIAVIVAALAMVYFRPIGTHGVVLAIAVILGLVELLSPILAGNHGGSLKMLAHAGIPVIVFPGLAWILRWLLPGASWYITLPIAAGLACLAGLAGMRHGSGRESARLLEATTAAAIPLYTLGLVLIERAPAAGLALACAALATAPIVAKIAITWPASHERVLVYASGVCGVAALLWGMAVIV